jgi:hypothetical protein
MVAILFLKHKTSTLCVHSYLGFALDGSHWRLCGISESDLNVSPESENSMHLGKSSPQSMECIGSPLVYEGTKHPVDESLYHV